MAGGTSALVWFRRDLRWEDHAALHHALREAGRVHCVFVFDTTILDALADRDDRRVAFIRASVVELDAGLDRVAREAGGQGAGLIVRHGDPRDVIPGLAAALAVDAVHVARDYEPAAIQRDHEVAERLRMLGVRWAEHRDQVIFERDEILTRAGRPYAVFTPYRQAWLAALDPQRRAPLAVAPWAARLAAKGGGERIPELDELGFRCPPEAPPPPGVSGAQARFEAFLQRIGDYHARRDYPAEVAGSGLSIDLRFGTVSIRSLVHAACTRSGPGPATWLSELVWREFYQQLLWHHPRVVHGSFKAGYDRIAWDDDPDALAAWCEGRTGYPIVDAAMRELNRYGTMHNRLRMIVASFLTKDLGIDWRRGERYFARRLNDYDLAANNGGWQWAASTGCDAQPWFRIFNPVTQSAKFDPDGTYIRRHLPELARVPSRWIHAPWTMPAAEQAAAGCRIGRDYPLPRVDHAEARERTLARFSGLRT